MRDNNNLPQKKDNAGLVLDKMYKNLKMGD
jgi:hypothetical protein